MIKNIGAPKKHDYTLSKYNRLTVLSRKIGAHSKWKVKCDCGTVRFCTAYGIVSGKVKSCGCYGAEQRRKAVVGHTWGRKKYGESSLNRHRTSIRNGAKHRGFVCSLSDKDMEDLMTKNCHYCGSPPKEHGLCKKYRVYGLTLTNGIDRKDPTVGYTLANCVPCCEKCNKMKRDYSYADFLSSICRIHQLHFGTATFSSFDEAYKTLLFRLYTFGSKENPRGLKIRELTDIVFSITSGECKIDFNKTAVPERQEVWDKYVKAELDWYRTGDDSAASAPSKFWLNLADEEGKINSNYGKLVLFDKHYPGGDSAIQYVVKLLTRDVSSRQAVIYYGLPHFHKESSKDIPCTVASQVLVRNGLVNLSIYQRSCDIIRGLSYDIPWHNWLLQEISSKLGLKAGNITHHSGSLHLYERDLEVANKILTPINRP